MVLIGKPSVSRHVDDQHYLLFFLKKEQEIKKKKTGVNEHGLLKVGGLPDW